MSVSHIVSITLMLAGVPLLIPALLPLLRRQYDRRKFLIAGAAVLHLIATVYAISFGVSLTANETETLGNLLFLLSFFVGLFAGLMLLGAVFLEPDGKIRFRNRKTPIPVPLLACVLLPVLFASVGHQFLPDINLIEYGFSLSVFLTDALLRHEAETAAESVLQQACLLAVPENFSTVGVGQEVVRYHVHQRGLARAVWSEQTVNAVCERVREVAECVLFSVVLVYFL